MLAHPLARQVTRAYGDTTDDLISAGKTAGAGFLASLLQSGTAQPLMQQAQQQAIETGGAKAFAWAQQNWKTIAMIAVGAAVVFGGGIYFIARKR